MFSNSGAHSHSMVHKYMAKLFPLKWSGGPKLPTGMNPLLWPESLFGADGKGDHEKVLKPVP